MTPTDAANSALHQLRDQTTPEDADRVLNIAASRGVDPDTCEALRAAWQEYHDACVTVLYSDPVTDAMERHPAGGAA